MTTYLIPGYGEYQESGLNGDFLAPGAGLVQEFSGADSEAPTYGGGSAITVTDKTHNSYILSWPAASDNVGVTQYRYSLDGGSNWNALGNVTTVDVSGRSPGATDNVAVQAGDAANNWSTSLTTDVTLLSLKIAPTIKDPTSDTARASQTGLGVIVLGEKPGSAASPTVLATSATETTDGSGVLDVSLNSSGKNPGDIVWLVLVKSDGNPANSGFSTCWPVAVEAA